MYCSSLEVCVMLLLLLLLLLSVRQLKHINHHRDNAATLWSFFFFFLFCWHFVNRLCVVSLIQYRLNVAMFMIFIL